MAKNPPAMQETWVQSLVWKDLLEEGMANHSSILAWGIPMDRNHKLESRQPEEISTTPWIARRSNHSILNEISPEYSLEGLILEAEAPKLWPPDAKSQLIGKDYDTGKD